MYMYMYMYVCVYIYIYTHHISCIYLYIHISYIIYHISYIYIYIIYIYIYTHTYTHTYQCHNDIIRNAYGIHMKFIWSSCETHQGFERRLRQAKRTISTGSTPRGFFGAFGNCLEEGPRATLRGGRGYC